MNLKNYIEWINNKTINQETIFSKYLEKATNSITNKENIYLRINNSGWRIDNDEVLKWAPIAIKDNIMQKWEISTCWSKILSDYIAPYSATCIENLEKNWWVVIWKTNMDEFAMGSSNETSYYWPCLNPYWTNRMQYENPYINPLIILYKKAE